MKTLIWSSVLLVSFTVMVSNAWASKSEPSKRSGKCSDAMSAEDDKKNEGKRIDNSVRPKNFKNAGIDNMFIDGLLRADYFDVERLFLGGSPYPSLHAKSPGGSDPFYLSMIISFNADITALLLKHASEGGYTYLLNLYEEYKKDRTYQNQMKAHLTNKSAGGSSTSKPTVPPGWLTTPATASGASSPSSISASPSYVDMSTDKKVLEMHTEGELEKEAIEDYVFWRWTTDIPENNTVTVLFGNAFHKPSDEEIKDLEVLLNALVEKDVRVIVDADSLLGRSALMKISASKQVIGVSAETHDVKLNIHAVRNPYLRMKIFSYGLSITTPDSITGLGILLNDKGDTIYATDKKWKDPAQNWAKALEDDGLNKFGIKYTLPTRVISRIGDVVSSVLNRRETSPYKKMDLRYSFTQAVKELGYFDKDQALKGATEYVKSRRTIEKVPNDTVIFGSGKNQGIYSDLVYNAAYSLSSQGHAITTGGAGGFMAIANLGAAVGGSPSIGIPKTKGKLIIGEEKAHAELHDVTVEVSSYDVRIPILLHDKSTIVIAPGGSGTLKELATTFVHLGSKTSIQTKVVFLSSDYYGSLMNDISVYLPVRLDKRITVIDDVHDIAKFVNKSDPPKEKFKKKVNLPQEALTAIFSKLDFKPSESGLVTYRPSKPRKDGEDDYGY